MPFEPTRTAGLAALKDFLPKAGTYAGTRNYDRPGHDGVSQLSPYIRHRMVTEAEVLEAVTGRFAPSTAEKFIQEVYWRTYWKGWLERRPEVWTAYRAGVTQGRNRVAGEGGLRKAWEAACTGATGIAPYDHWAQELVETGYLHNHARMWFASIWCFTLRLPWELGADFFLRHLLDGDPASNTLGWRWVAGLQTPGKTYVARASNITKYTDGRFGAIHGLAQEPAPLQGMANPPAGPVPLSTPWTPGLKTGLLCTEDDLSPSWLLQGGLAPETTAVLLGVDRRSPWAVAPPVVDFTRAAAADMVARHGDRLGQPGPISTDPGEIDRWAEAAGLEQVVMPHAPVGPAAERVAVLRDRLSQRGVTLCAQIRPYDAEAWPFATAGFFKFKAKIPTLLRAHMRGGAEPIASLI